MDDTLKMSVEKKDPFLRKTCLPFCTGPILSKESKLTLSKNGFQKAGEIAEKGSPLHLRLLSNADQIHCLIECIEKLDLADTINHFSC